MSEKSRISTSLLAHVRALLPDNWRGRAGKRFRKTLSAISSTLEESGAPPHELPTKLTSLAVEKLEGYAQKEKAAAMKDFSEAEERRIDALLKARSLESRVRKEEAEARLVEIEVMKAELDLAVRLKEAGVMLQENGPGKYTVIPVPKGFSFEALCDRLALESQTDTNDEGVPPA